MSNEVNHTDRIVRSLIAGIMGLANTLVALGATGLLADMKTGIFACFISFVVGCSLRLGVEYGVTTPNTSD